MSILQKLMQTAAQVMPDRDRDELCAEAAGEQRGEKQTVVARGEGGWEAVEQPPPRGRHGAQRVLRSAARWRTVIGRTLGTGGGIMTDGRLAGAHRSSVDSSTC